MTEVEFQKLPILMTVKEVQTILGIGRNSIYEKIYRKEIPIVRLGERQIRIHKDDFIKWIECKKEYYEFNEEVSYEI